MSTKAAVLFFYDQAGFSYNPNTETAEQGHARTARELARAEAWAREQDISFVWSIDQITDSSDWSDEKPAYEQWCCLAYDVDGNVINSLGGVDFGRDGTPHASHYRRVVEAEIALDCERNNL